MVFSEPLVVGGVRTGALVANGPLKSGFPVQLLPEFQPRGGALTSVTSAEFRPKLGLPQTARSSLVCTGPSIWSPPTKTIWSQNWLLVPGIGELSRPSRRNLVHWL